MGNDGAGTNAAGTNGRGVNGAGTAAITGLGPAADAGGLGLGSLSNQAFNGPGTADSGANTASDYQNQLDRIRHQQLAQMNQQQISDQKDAIQSAMAAQATQLFTAWLPPPTQVYTEGTPAKEKNGGKAGAAGSGGQSAAGQGNGGAGGASAQTPIIKSGSVLFGALITSVNSDQNGPVLARVVTGKFKGAKLIGRFEPTNNNTATGADKLTITFSSMTLPSVPVTIDINAVAIDPDTARTALSTYTDHHYLLRYGTLFASAFLEGYAQALTQSGATTTIQPTGTTTFSFPSLSGKQKFAVALGTVGDRYSSVLGSTFTMPPTVYVKSGTGIGILFLNDVLPASQ